MNWPKAALILGLCAILATAWLSRWSAPVYIDKATAITQDRFTGQWWVVYSTGMLKVDPTE